MREYDYQAQLNRLWDWTVSQYERGNRDPESYSLYNLSERTFLEEIGMKPGELVDFAEDYLRSGEPDFATVAMIQEVRRAYLEEMQGGNPSSDVIDPNSLPAPDSEAAGIPWLPRIVEKARAKLHGELDPDVMYACPNDRRFLKEHDVHPATFLRKLWETEEDPSALVEWFSGRSKARAHAA